MYTLTSAYIAYRLAPDLGRWYGTVCMLMKFLPCLLSIVARSGVLEDQATYL
jgi:hypothetical protein